MATVRVRADLGELNKLMKQIAPRLKIKVGIIDNPDVAEYAAYNEFGWVQKVTGAQAAYLSGALGHDVKTRGMKNAPIKPGYTLMSPPRPFLRATARDCADKWHETIKKGVQKLGVTKLPQVAEMIGRQAQVDVQETIKNNGTSKERFPDRSPLTLELYKRAEALTASGRKRKMAAGAGATRKKALLNSGVMHKTIGYRIEQG